MTSSPHLRFSITLCIALVVAILPLIGAVEPAAADVQNYGCIVGTIRADDLHRGPVVPGITVRIYRLSDERLEKTLTSDGNGYFNTLNPKLQDPQKKGFRVEVNLRSESGYNPDYGESVQYTIYLKGEEEAVSNHMIRSLDTPSTKVILSGKVVADAGGRPLEGIKVSFERRDGKTEYATTDKDGVFRVTVEKYLGNCGGGSRCYNIVANKEGVAGYHSDWFNSSWQLNFKPSGDRTLPTFRLLTGTVTFKGRVVAGSKGLEGISVYLLRHDRQAWSTVTNENGIWRQEIPRSVWKGPLPDTKDHRIYLAINNQETSSSYNSEYTTPPDKNNIPSLVDYNDGTVYLQSRLVTISGRVTDARHGWGIPGITVFLYRQDKPEKSLYAVTDARGYYSQKVERSSNPATKYNLAANKPDLGNDHPMNTSYTYDAKKDINNIGANGNAQNKNFNLEPTFVLLSGKVVDKKTNLGIPGIEVYFWRKDGKEDAYATTGSDGTFTKAMSKSCVSGDSSKYMIAANKGNPGHPRHPAYAYDPAYTYYNRNDISACNDRPGLNFLLESSRVTFSGKVTRSRSTEGIPGIQVLFHGNNGVDARTTTGTGGEYSLQVARSYDTAVKYTPMANSNTDLRPINPGYSVGKLNGRVPNGDQGSINFVLDPVATPPPTTPPVPTIEPPRPVPTTLPPNRPLILEVGGVRGEMISANEFGIGTYVTYPSSATEGRYLTITADINGKLVQEQFEVTQWTTPLTQWKATVSEDHVASNTPLRINLEKHGVPKFSGDTVVKVTVKASYDGSRETSSAYTEAKVRIPVLILHGACPPEEYPHCTVTGGFIDYLLNYAGYASLTSHLMNRGYYYRYDYSNIYYPETAGPMYTNPLRAVPSDILRDMDARVSRAMASSYSKKVNLVGHSFGGLVSQYYASQRPGNVAKVITVGTPFKGITNIYNEMFSPAWNRAMVDRNMTTPGGQPNLILWGVPEDYDGYELPSTRPAGINVQVSNTYDYTPHRDVEYHYIYATNIPTDRTVKLAVNEDSTWYRSVSVSKGNGDGTVLDFSGANLDPNGRGPTGTNIIRHPLQAGSIEGLGGLKSTNHGTLMMDDIVHNEIMKAIDYKQPAIRGQPVNDAAGVNPSVTIRTPGIGPSVIDLTG